jgi:hypothetical protein
MNLLTNRYGQKTPTHIQANGCSISTPIYFTPTSDQLKELLNAFREKVRQQRLEMGWTDETVVTNNGVRAVTATQPPKTQIEEELGMNEENLRYALFQRTGIAERLVLKLCTLCEVEFVSREAIEATYKEWLDYLYDGNKGVKKTRKRSTTKSKVKDPV